MSLHSPNDLRSLVDLGISGLSIRRQCELLGLSRSSYYYQPQEESPENLHLMSLLEKRHHDHPEEGSPRLTKHLQLDHGLEVNRKRAMRLMKLMRIRSILPRPRTSQPGEGHKTYPYLLKGLKIKGPNHVWAVDITFIRIQGGFVYLVAIIDWHSRFVLAWELSNSMDVSFCIDALQTAFDRWGKPEIFNSDQGSQFTSIAFTSQLL
ncbi:MAG: IS3 family transposase, partial [Bacteroidota bacterium]